MDGYWNLASTVGQTIYINSDLLASSGTDWWTISGVFFSTVTAIAGVVIAIKAHFLSRTATEANRLHNRLSVRPLLGTHTAKTYEPAVDNLFSLGLSNNGVGPAIITRFLLQVGGVTIVDLKEKKDRKGLDLQLARHDFINLLNCGRIHPKINILTPGSSCSANTKTELIHIHFYDATFEEAFRAIEQIELHIEYSNIYNEPMEPLNTHVKD